MPWFQRKDGITRLTSALNLHLTEGKYVTWSLDESAVVLFISRRCVENRLEWFPVRDARAITIENSYSRYGS